jgi:hypothetical protein
MIEVLKTLIEDLRLNHEYCPKEVILQAADELERLSQRTWVDLTRTQMQDVYFEVLKEHRGGHQIQGQIAFGEALQAKIKEKNT